MTYNYTCLNIDMFSILNKTHTHTHTHTYIYIYIYIIAQKMDVNPQIL